MMVNFSNALLLFCVGLCSVIFQTSVSENPKDAIKKQFSVAPNDKNLSLIIEEILEHYKHPDPIGIPSAPIPEPMLVPPLVQSLSMAKLNMENIKVYGLSQFRIHHVNIDLAKMQCEAALTIETLYVYGNYTLGTWLSKSKGPFTVTMKNVYAKAVARLEVERTGHLEAQEINMDITFQHIDMKFENLGLFASVFQGIINSVGTFVFDSIKPFILKEMNTNIRRDLNTEIAKSPITFPNSIAPFDQMMGLVRSYIRNSSYDPLLVPDYNHTAGLFDVRMTHTWLTGLSSIHRVGNVSFEVKGGLITGDVEVGTQRLEGNAIWEVSMGAGMISRAGRAKFTVEYIKVQIMVTQAMDTTKSPVLDDIHIELGNIQVRFDGAGTLDYIIEASVNILPNLLRYQIMKALESPLRMRVQDELNKITIEQLFKDHKDMLDDPEWQLSLQQT